MFGNSDLRPRIYLYLRLLYMIISAVIMILGAIAASLYGKKDRIGATKEVMIVVPPAMAVIFAAIDLLFPKVPRVAMLVLDTLTWPTYLTIGVLLSSGYLGGWGSRSILSSSSSTPTPVTSPSTAQTITSLNLIICFLYYLAVSLAFALKGWLCMLVHRIRMEKRRLWVLEEDTGSAEDFDIAAEIQKEIFWSLEGEEGREGRRGGV